ncbi:Putative sporulation transcription regulator WhiA (plasmid) [Mycobacterium sp. THAF192]|nr:Putative sporulation transcription regulator WhiA [Mycobacterium sp. THAF192]
MANNPRWAEVSADANQARARAAGHQQAELARAALEVLQAQQRPGLHAQRWVQALQCRISHPDATLAELGQSMTPPMTKHAYAALLRRALRAAASDSGERPTGRQEGV